MLELKQATGDLALVEALRQFGVEMYAGVNSGGLIHLGKRLEPLTNLDQAGDGVPRLLTMGEYVAGFIPLGYYLASGRIGGCMTTSGAAIKLASSGVTDAKVMNIPAVYLFGLNNASAEGLGPLQDVSHLGMNIVPQLQAELGEGCVVIDSIDTLADRLAQVQRVLKASRPVAIAFYPDVLARPISIDLRGTPSDLVQVDNVDLQAFMDEFPSRAAGRRVIIYVCAEAARYGERMSRLTTQLSELLHAPTVWSVNGANAVSPANSYGYGHISFGGNDAAMKLWRSINADDVMICLGFDSGEFALALGKIPAGIVWHFTALRDAYGTKNGDFRHRVAGEYRLVRGSLDEAVEQMASKLAAAGINSSESEAAPTSLNDRTLDRNVADGCVDLVELYERLNVLWRPRSIGFDDICMSSKDRQYVMQRPNPAIRFYALGDGCAMGNAFGLGVGAKLGDPDLHSFVFSGDGCWRLFAGALADCAHLDVRLFIINNGSYALVDDALSIVIPDVDRRLYHTHLPRIDFVGAARAHGWESFKLNPDLSNLETVMDKCYTESGRSIMVEVPSDPYQRIGQNPRLVNFAKPVMRET